MIDTPENVFMLDEYIDVGIDGVSIDLHDLTTLILGCDQNNEKTVSMYDEGSLAVQKAVASIAQTCKKRGIKCSLYTQSMMRKDMIKNAVSWGVTSISVGPNVVDQTRMSLHEAETEHGHHASKKPTTFQKIFNRNR